MSLSPTLFSKDLSMNFEKLQRGLTLVELLVAITILTIVTALVVPRIRVINKERTIREAARVAGSVFSTARDRAIAEGTAGVIIQRNLNFSTTTGSGNRVFFAGTRLFQMRNVPDYIGDTLGAVAVVEYEIEPDGDDADEEPDVVSISAKIDKPLEFLFPDEQDFNDAFPPVISAGDSIQIGTLRYQIFEITPDPDDVDSILLVLDWDNDRIFDNSLDITRTDFVSNSPAPMNGLMAEFSIERQPRKIESSVVDLPAGYIVDLRYSGPIEALPPDDFDNDAETATTFGRGLAADADQTLPQNSEIRVVFDRLGSVDKVLLNGESELVGASLSLLINEFDPGLQLGTQAMAETLLSNPESLWVTVGLNGGVSIGYSAPVVPADLDVMVLNARTLSSNRTSALQ